MPIHGKQCVRRGGKGMGGVTVRSASSGDIVFNGGGSVGDGDGGGSGSHGDSGSRSSGGDCSSSEAYVGGMIVSSGKC